VETVFQLKIFSFTISAAKESVFSGVPEISSGIPKIIFGVPEMFFGVPKMI